MQVRYSVSANISMCIYDYGVSYIAAMNVCTCVSSIIVSCAQLSNSHLLSNFIQRGNNSLCVYLCGLSYMSAPPYAHLPLA